MLSSLSPSSPPPAADPIRDVGLADFMADVVDASRNVLIVVDFWSPRSPTCKQLMPVVEKLVRSYKGLVQLAKVDIDKNPQIAQQMGVQSVPAIFAFFQGRPVDGFMGALPEAQIKTWIDRLLKATGAGAPPSDDVETGLKQAAEFLAAKDVATAQAIYMDILSMEPNHPAANAGVLRCLLAEGDTEGAKAMFSQLPPEITKDKAFDAVRAALELAAQAGQSGGVNELQKKLEQNPADHQVRFDLAMAHYAAGQREEAVDQLLEIVRRARTWNEDAARKQLVKFFEAFGSGDPLTLSARKRLSSLLFA